jgi:Methyltransferase domain/C-methyltransferase C-terminal domain
MSDLGATEPICPSCGGAGMTFYELGSVPVHQVKLVRSRAEALAGRKGDIRLAFCRSCGFVWNAAFDVALMQYQEDYESTQAVSPTFNRFHDHLARDLIERFDLHGKEIVELGCGQGEFITMLADYGDNHGYGFDQVIRDDSGSERIKFVKDYYGPRYSHLRPDFVACKMTLEHVHNTGEFIRGLRATVGDHPETVVFFMIPEITRILKLAAFWDVYYEHCSYFSPGSLARTFRLAGLDPIEVWTDYEDQYVLIAARPGFGKGPVLANEAPPDALLPKVQAFPGRVAKDRARWQGILREAKAAGKRTVLWGGGSKAVAFLTTIGATDELLSYAVDVNPRRSGTYIAGTGHEIVGPEFLRSYRPDVVIVMSPIYLPEINAQLDSMGVRPETLIPVADAA